MTSERFPDLASPGVQLAERLRSFITNETIVLGIASGGVPAAAVVANELGLSLDVVIIKRLFARNDPMSPVCATSVAGSLVIDELSPQMTELPAADSFVNFSLTELARRETFCRGGKAVAEIRGNDVIVVDNGVHTGSTLSCAIRALRKLEPRRIVSAIPVIAAESQQAIGSVTDELIFLTSRENFGHVGLWYSDFTKPTDEEIRQTLNNSTASSASHR